MFDVFATVPIAESGLTRIQFASGVTEDTAETIKSTMVWEVRYAPAERASLELVVPAVSTDLVLASEYMVWMRYPTNGTKTPWSLVAQGVAPDQTSAYLNNLLWKVNVMPTHGKEG